MQGAVVDRVDNTYEIRNFNLGFQGVRNGEDITLTFNYDGKTTLDGQTITGMVNKDGLTLLLASTDGKLVPRVFQESDSQSYNHAVQRLENQFAEYLHKQQEVAKQKQFEASQKNAAKNLSDIFNSLDAYVNELYKVNLQAYDDKFDNFVSQLRSAFKNIQSKADGRQLTYSEISDLRSAVSDMRSLESDARSLGSDLRSDINTIESNVSDTETLVTRLNKAWSDVLQLQAQTNFKQADINTLLQQATESMKLAKSEVEHADSYQNQYMNKMSEIIDQADTYVANLQGT